MQYQDSCDTFEKVRKRSPGVNRALRVYGLANTWFVCWKKGPTGYTTWKTESGSKFSPSYMPSSLSVQQNITVLSKLLPSYDYLPSTNLMNPNGCLRPSHHVHIPVKQEKKQCMFLSYFRKLPGKLHVISTYIPPTRDWIRANSKTGWSLVFQVALCSPQKQRFLLLKNKNKENKQPLDHCLRFS